MYTRLFLLLLLFNFPTIMVVGEVKDSLRATPNKYWLQTGIAVAHQTFWDEGISPVRYRTTGLNLSLQWWKWKEKNIQRTTIEGSFGAFSTSRATDLRPMRIAHIRGLIQYDYWRKTNISIAKNWNISIGGCSQLYFIYKQAPQLDNSSLVYDFSWSIGPSVLIDHKFSIRNKKFWLGGTAYIPIVSYISRPAYLNRVEFIQPKHDLLDSFLGESRLALWNRYWQIAIQAQLHYLITDTTRLSLFYGWDLYHMRTHNEVFHGRQMFGGQLNFIF